MLFVTTLMFCGAASILIFKMLVGVANYPLEADFFYGFFETSIGSQILPQLPIILSTVWISVMNICYGHVARMFNDLENYRTETEYNNSLIIKTVLFQFFNSYCTLFYIAFIKSNEVPIGAVFQQNDPTSGQPYRDMCGVRPSASQLRDDPDRWLSANTNPNCNVSTFENCNMLFVQRDCFDDLRTLMISYTLLKPCYELPLQVFGNLIAKCVGQRRERKKKQQQENNGHDRATIGWFSKSSTDIKKKKDGASSTAQLDSSSVSSDVQQTASAAEEGNVEVQVIGMGRSRTQSVGGRWRSVSSQLMNATRDRGKTLGKVAADSMLNYFKKAGSSGAGTKAADLPGESSTTSSFNRGSEPLGRDGGSVDEKEERKKFHYDIGLQEAQKPYGGTFTEYNPKVIQFGFIAMFSSAFPLAAVCAAVGNFVELRLDSLKLVSLSRRPRYIGAENIGSWEVVLTAISWIALPVNVLILVFTSWEFRRLFVIPLVLGHRLSCDDPNHQYEFNAQPLNHTSTLTGATHLLPIDYLVTHHAAYESRQTSFLAPCVENVYDCFANIGGEPWLPATKYLPNTSTFTYHYTRDGLCNRDSQLFHEFHCQTCTGWIEAVWGKQLLIAVIVEHLLLILKMYLSWAIPDKPRWVLDAVARRQFHNEMRVLEKEANQRRLSHSEWSTNEYDGEEKRQQLVKRINMSDDQADPSPSGQEIVSDQI